MKSDMADNQVNSSEDVDAILRIALNKSGGTDELRVRLQKSAEELGISPAALAQAEEEYRQTKLLVEYKKYRRNSFTSELSWFMLIGIWWFTGHGYFWPIFPILGMSLGLCSQVGKLLASNGATPSDPGFQKWLAKREERALKGSGTVVGISIGQDN